MAKLHEVFNLNFHEADSSIQIEFGEDEKLLEIGEANEVLPIPIEFEESTSRIPVNIADTEDVAAYFSDVIVIDGGSHHADSYTKAETNALLDQKVDKVEGKGLSTNDLTDELLEKINSTGEHEEVRIFSDSGQFTATQAEILKKSPSNYINYLGKLFKLKFKSPNIYKYFSDYADVNQRPMITVNFTENTWQYDLIVNGILQDHINDNQRHINSGEREFWNNKLNYDTVSNERLILNRF